jgi:hypothetical protein
LYKTPDFLKITKMKNKFFVRKCRLIEGIRLLSLKINTKKLCSIFIVLVTVISAKAQKNTDIKSCEIWYDTNGKMINAHSAGLLFFKGVYYWYGEYKGDSTYRNPKVPSWECYRTEAGGVSCYSSRDLYNWKFEGLVLPPDVSNPESDLHPSGVMERPKVIYNEKTKKFVMWLHIDSHDYQKAATGVAICDSPTGKFQYLGSMRPNGQMSRDMTLFKDDDGKAYHIYSSENNETMYISLLSDDYLKPSGKYTRNFIKLSREAPAIFKYKKKYYLLSSACTGWSPNEAMYATADSVLGKWTVVGNPCVGKDADKTFMSQSTYVLPVAGEKDAYIAMFDRWDKTNLKDSRYVWLPAKFENGKLVIKWKDKWDLNIFK